MGVIIGVIVGYVMGTKSGETGLAELKDAWKHDQIVRGGQRDHGGRAVDGRRPDRQGWWTARRTVADRIE